MFKNQITVRVSKQYYDEIAGFVYFDIKTYGNNIDEYEEDDKVYITITTRMTPNKLGKEIEKRRCKAKTSIHGNIIFVEMES